MKRIIKYIYLFIGLLFFVTGVSIMLDSNFKENYEFIFGFEISRLYYIIYKISFGLILITASFIKNKEKIN